MFQRVFAARMDEVDIACARQLRDQSWVNLQNQRSWQPDSSHLLMAPRFLPANHNVADSYRSTYQSFCLGGEIKQYIGLDDGDPHLLLTLLKLRDAISQAGFDPDQQETTTDCIKPHFLVALGTGDGSELLSLLNQFQACHLFVAVQDWNQFISSFWIIDWQEIWTVLDQHPTRKISIGRYDSATGLISALASECLAGLEHSVIFHPDDGINQSQEIQAEIASKLITASVNYLGFTLDEYNMIWNAWRSMRVSPRVFRQPLQPLPIRCVICGSGPSLDDSIPLLHELQSTHLIVACGSNYGTLRANGIDVDLLVLLERGEVQVEDYGSLIKKYGAGGTRLLASSTCSVGLHALFSDTAVFHRPSLTPLALFSDSPREVLPYEGPQTVNTGLAWAAAIQAQEVILVGVDLGVRVIDQPRSVQAVGSSPRDFTLERPANFGGTVFTERLLLDTQLTLELCIKHHPSLTVYNASDGLAIEGARPVRLSSYVQDQLSGDAWGENSRELLNTWWNSLPRYKPQRFVAAWTARRPRPAIADCFAKLRDLYGGTTPWFPELLLASTRLLDLSVSPRDQFPRRLIRAVLHKLTITVTRQLMVMGRNPQAQAAFGGKARELMVELLDAMERECYQLCDALETL